MTTEEYRNYKILFEKCYAEADEEVVTDVGVLSDDFDSLLKNENPKKEPEDEL